MFHGRGRHVRDRLIQPALIAGLALTVAACGGAATSTSTPAGGGATGAGPSAGGGAATPTSAVLTLPPGAPSFTAPTLTFTIALTGAVPLSGSLSETVAPAYPPANRVCSDVRLADVAFQGTFASHEVGLTLDAVNSSPTTGAIALDISSYVSIDTGEDSVFSPTDTSSTAKLNGDGTGSLMLAKWTSATGRTESGTITWTCTS